MELEMCFEETNTHWPTFKVMDTIVDLLGA